MPKINFRSRSIMMSKGRDIYKTEQNLINYGKERDELLRKRKEDKENLEISVNYLNVI